MTLAGSDGATGYSSVFDTVGGISGAGAPGGGTGEATATDGAAPEAEVAESDGISAAVRPELEDDIVIVLLDGGPQKVDSIHEGVNARPGDHVPKGVIERKLGEMKAASRIEIHGDTWELTDMVRGELETPAVVVHRRATLMRTAVVMSFPDGTDLDAGVGFSAPELQGFMAADGAGLDSEGPTGALTPNGYVVQRYPLDVVAGDLAALLAGGILVEEQPDAAEASEEEEIDEDQPQDEDDGEEEDDDEPEGDIASEIEDGLEDETPAAALAAAREPVYIFAKGMVARLLTVGAEALVLPTVAGAVARAEVAVAAGESAQAADRSAFEAAANARLRVEQEKVRGLEAMLLRLHTLLASKRLAFLYEEAKGAPQPVAPSRVVFEFTQTVPMNDGERAVLLREVASLEEKIALEEARIEGAKKALKSTKSLAEEELEKLKDTKSQTFAARHGHERTYTVPAWSDFHAEGDAESEGQPVNYVRAVDDNRILRRDVLGPREALAAHAGDLPKPTSPEAPAPRAPASTNPAAVLAATPPATLAAAVAEKLGNGATASVVDGVATVTVPARAGTPADKPITFGATDYSSVIGSYLLAAGAKGAVSEEIERKTKIPLDVIVATLTGAPDRFVQGADGIWRLTDKTAAAGSPDDATKAAAASAAEQATKAAAVPRSSKLAMNPEGLKLPLLGVLAAAGAEGIPVAELGAKLCAHHGLAHSANVDSMVKLSAKKLEAETPCRVTRRGDLAGDVLALTFHDLVLEMVGAAGDTGLRVDDVSAHFEKLTGIPVTPTITARLGEAIEVEVGEENLARGPLPGDIGDLLWIDGEPDPRSAAAPEPAKATPAPAKGRGRAAAKTAATPPAAKATAKAKK